MNLVGVHRAVKPLLDGRPQGWDAERFKALFVRLEQRNADLSYEMLSLRSTGHLVARAEMGGRQEPHADSLPRYLRAEVGDLVINPMWLIGGGIGVARCPGAVSPDYRVFRSRVLHSGYVHYLLRSQPYVDQYRLYTRAQTTFDRRVQQQDLDNLPVLVPPLTVQRAIADYLDRETVRIDTLIGEQKGLIGLLRERRQRVLSIASDGHWPTTRLGLVLEGIKDGTHGSFARTAPGEGMPLLGARNVMGSRVALDGAESFISAEDYESIVANGFPAAGDVLLVIVGATIGKTAVYELSQRHAFQRSVAFLRPSERLQSKYLWYQIQSRHFQDELALRAKTSAQPGIYMGDVAAIPVSVPPLAAQQEIVRHLDEQTAKIDKLIAETERFIELSRERRAALITAAVTGQIDVREVA